MSELIDREALKDAVKRYAGEPIKKKDRKCQAICLDMLGTIDSQPAASPWHRVEEPPEVGQNVLTMDANEDMETATYDGEGFEDSYGFYVTDVLYWMPIEPPKEA